MWRRALSSYSLSSRESMALFDRVATCTTTGLKMTFCSLSSCARQPPGVERQQRRSVGRAISLQKRHLHQAGAGGGLSNAA